MNIDIEATEIFEKNYDYTKGIYKPRIIVNRGGTRSSKTYSLAQLWMLKSFEEKKKRILVTRATFPALRLSAMQDFLTVLEDYDARDYFQHNRSYNYFENKLTGTQIHFIASDTPQKVRSQKWDYIQMVEGNEMSFEVFRQYILRSPGQVVIDFNPSDSDTWINVEVEQKRSDIEVIKSSYLDNPFLPDEVVREIEYLRSTDPMYWQIYGLGEYGNIRNKVWDGWKTISEVDYDSVKATDIFYAHDPGFVNPRGCIEFKYSSETIFMREIFYEKYTKVDDLISKLEKVMPSKDYPVYCDPENAQEFADLIAAGFYGVKANKRVKWGLDYVRRFNDIRVCNSSVNLLREYNKYKYQEDNDGRVIEKPVKFDDHLMDCVRYGIVSHLHWVFT